MGERVPARVVRASIGKYIQPKIYFLVPRNGWLPTHNVNARTQFGAAVRQRRIERDLTQEELAFRADLSVVYLRGIENGRNNPTLHVLFDLGKALGVHPAEMLAGIPLDAETHGGDRKRPGPPEGTLRGPKNG